MNETEEAFNSQKFHGKDNQHVEYHHDRDDFHPYIVEVLARERDTCLNVEMKHSAMKSSERLASK